MISQTLLPTTLNTVWIARFRQLPTVPRLFFMAMGFVPIGSLCAALFGLLPLQLGLRFVVLPLGLFTIGVGIRYPQLGRLALRGLLVGIVATMVYDLVRLSFVMAGTWGDFIPVIGKLALNDESASPIWGYLWRFIGNGGMMGMAFAFVPWRGARAGIIYGIGICCCLFGTLLIAPGAQDTLFHLTALTGLMALIGHIIYGCVLGWLLQRVESSAPGTQYAELPGTVQYS
ncbi:hypothetical protein [Archangium sp.]|uniref:hypothetical protein n=1 Tax=Archangium sp. TaxID=1872627 RepID=UPI002D3D9048|nr:hypothetical protein [Archangium sp.]HYO57091.1 hypothetical protein [Archangium sp.]